MLGFGGYVAPRVFAVTIHTAIVGESTGKHLARTAEGRIFAETYSDKGFPA